MGGPNPNRIKLSQLRALAAVVQCRNFSEAALHLDVSQSAVSHAIAALESELGVQLLLRGRHGAEATPVGEQIAQRAATILESVSDLVQDANIHKGLHGGQVRVATFRSVATHVLPEVIAQFQQKYPNITVDIAEHNDYPQVEKALLEGRADVGFTYLPSPEEFETWELLRDEYVVLLPPNSVPTPPQLTWEQLAQFPLIVPPEQDSCSFIVRKHFERHKQPFQPVYRFREDTTTVRMVDRGVGAAILPRLAADPIPPGVQICSLPVKLERVIGSAVLADSLQPPAAFAFLDALKTWATAIALAAS